MADERITRARWLVGQVTAGMHAGTATNTVYNWAAEAYTLLCEVLDGKEAN